MTHTLILALQLSQCHLIPLSCFTFFAFLTRKPGIVFEVCVQESAARIILLSLCASGHDAWLISGFIVINIVLSYNQDVGPSLHQSEESSSPVHQHVIHILMSSLLCSVSYTHLVLEDPLVLECIWSQSGLKNKSFFFAYFSCLFVKLCFHIAISAAASFTVTSVIGGPDVIPLVPLQ